MTKSRSFQFADDICIYCEFEGMVIILENEDGEQVMMCQACIEAAVEEFDNQDLALRSRG